MWGGFGLTLRREFAALGIENNGDDKGGEHKACAEFGGPQARDAGAARLRVEKGLDKEIVAGVQEHASPNAAGFQAHPGEEKADSQHHHREARDGIPQRAGTVIVRKQNEGLVPKRPDCTADQSDARV